MEYCQYFFRFFLQTALFVDVLPMLYGKIEQRSERVGN